MSTVTKKKIIQDSKLIKSEHISEVPTFKSTTLPPQLVTNIPVVRDTDYQIIAPPQTEFKTEEMSSETETTESGIQTSSISKQSSLQYFVKKLKGEEESTIAKEVKDIKIEPIKPDLYKKFEDVSKTTDIKVEKEFVQRPTDFKRETEKMKQSKFLEELQLTPEPPPEICYIPKSEGLKTREEISEKIKLLEEIQDLPPSEIPRGGVKILPTPTRTETPTLPKFDDKTVTKSTDSSFSSIKHEKTFSEHSTVSLYHHSESTFKQQHAPAPEIRPISPRPSTQALEMEKLWAKSKSPEVDRPASATSSYSATEKHVYTRPLPEQSSEHSERSVSVHEMEKTWAHKSSDTHLEKSWPPSQQEKQTVAPSWSVHSTLEKKWTPYETRTETAVTESAFSNEQVPHYIANVSHTSKTTEQLYTKSENVEYSSTKSEKEVIDEQSLKASEIIKTWPPAPPTPTTFKPAPRFVPPVETLPIRPASVQDITDEVYLEPGPPPEIGFAEPPRERRQSYVETIEQDLEKNLEREPTKVLPGAVRTMPPPKEKYVAPPPLPPRMEYQTPPPLPAKPIQLVEKTKKPVVIESQPFQRFPELEPFPFRPQPEKPKPPRVAPPPTPSKFVKGKFTDSDYESDFESARIPSRWRPSSSDTEGPSYRRVAPPKATTPVRSKSVEREPPPPSQFDQPPQFQGPPRPVVSFEDSRELRREATQQIKKQTKHSKIQEVRREIPPVQIKPGSPPIFVQPERKPKPESPKTKHRTVVDGYMADTDEPFVQQQRKVSKHEYKFEENATTEYKQMYQSSGFVSESSQQKSVPKPHVPHKVFQHKKHAPPSSYNKVCFTYFNRSDFYLAYSSSVCLIIILSSMFCVFLSLPFVCAIQASTLLFINLFNFISGAQCNSYCNKGPIGKFHSKGR